MPSQIKPLSVLFVLSTLHFGGAEIQTITLVNKLNRDRFRVGLIYLKREERLLPELNTQKIDLLWCGDFKKGWTLSGLFRLSRCVKTFQPDVIVCVNSYPLLYGHLANWITSSCARIIEVYHTTELPDVKTKRIQKLYRYFFNWSDRIVYVCKNQRQYWETKGLRADLGMHIYNGIDTLHFCDRYSDLEKSELRLNYSFHKNDFVVGICAALRPEKNHVELLEAIKNLKLDGLPVKLLIIGDGPERAVIESIILKLELTADVVITGYQNDVRLYLAVCDVFAITSSSVETFSLAVLEAMAMNRTVVASNIGGAAEQIDHGSNGFLYERGNITALTNALKSVSKKNVSIEMGLAGRRKVKKLYSQQVMIQQYEQMLLDSVGQTSDSLDLES